MEYRIGENGLLPFRTQRVFNVGAQWFFAVRDGRDQGPFDNKLDAEIVLNTYLDKVTSEQQYSQTA